MIATDTRSTHRSIRELTSSLQLSHVISDRVENRTKCDEINMGTSASPRIRSANRRIWRLQWVSISQDHRHYPSVRARRSVYITYFNNERQYPAIPIHESDSIQINIFKSSALTLLFRLFIIARTLSRPSKTRVVLTSTSRLHTRHNTTHVHVCQNRKWRFFSNDTCMIITETQTSSWAYLCLRHVSHIASEREDKLDRDVLEMWIS